MFVVILNAAASAAARAEIVAGLEGVRDSLLRGVWAGAGEALAPADLAALLAALEDPASWLGHGIGDGRPYWHWWAPLGAGSVSVQRLTAMLPAQIRATAAMRDAATALAGCAEELRGLASARGAARFALAAGAEDPG